MTFIAMGSCPFIKRPNPPECEGGFHSIITHCHEPDNAIAGECFGPTFPSLNLPSLTDSLSPPHTACGPCCSTTRLPLSPLVPAYLRGSWGAHRSGTPLGCYGRHFRNHLTGGIVAVRSIKRGALTRNRERVHLPCTRQRIAMVGCIVCVEPASGRGSIVIVQPPRGATNAIEVDAKPGTTPTINRP